MKPGHLSQDNFAFFVLGGRLRKLILTACWILGKSKYISADPIVVFEGWVRSRIDSQYSSI